MAKTVNINVTPKRAGIARIIIMQTAFWSLLVGAEAASRLTFGGAWPIDLLVLMVGALAILGTGSILNGLTVSMTPAEVDAWIDAGMPAEAKTWLHLHRNRKASDTVQSTKGTAHRDAVLKAARLS